MRQELRPQRAVEATGDGKAAKRPDTVQDLAGRDRFRQFVRARVGKVAAGGSGGQRHAGREVARRERGEKKGEEQLERQAGTTEGGAGAMSSHRPRAGLR